MKKYGSPIFITRFLLVGFAFGLGLALYDKLPDPIPTHWNLEGVADDWTDKKKGVWLIPSLSLIMLFFFPILAKIDPRRKNYAKFGPAWELIQTVIIGFLVYIYSFQLYVSLHPEKSGLMGTAILSAVGLMFLVLGYVMPRVESNYFVGIRTPWTLEDKEVWKKTHRLGGKMFMLAGILMIGGGFVYGMFFELFIAAIVIAALIPVVYSYGISRKN